MAKFRRRAAWSLGYDLTRIAKGNSDEALFAQLAARVKPDIVLDVGANEGQFAVKALRTRGAFRVISFEPLSSAHDALSQAAKGNQRWIVAPRGALGEANGKATINISGFSQSSSLREMNATHLKAVPESAYCATEEVDIRRLDEAVADFIKPSDRLYLKIDTQGFERNVLDGASGIMGQVCAAQLELSFHELYKGEALALDMIAHMTDLGFHLFALCNGTRDRESGYLLQADGYFIR